ncbi:MULTISPECIES: sulfotransferase [unclassified Pseudofrankia]|uniref:sulfotransferase n=1 Tax=unclassified Pseudofrankia TaxID=2994372 RepID=UPI0008D96114|nr:MULTISPECIES: sulfotransferase [unclassified Pseudofrankia]MDT3445007.1 sulfotransferase [Pseudofrankia sp. BMG5.37]OHV68196.1 hypothetical protein BCD48_03160 [Pseudofrankia sp. BMG5.36]
MTRPDFVVAAPPETGGTRLVATLARHPGLRLTAPRQATAAAVPADQHRTPSEPGGAPAGDAWGIDGATGVEDGPAVPAGSRHGVVAPYLLADFAAQRRLHECTAYPRLLVALRDPIDRAYAAWRRARTTGTEPLADFVAALLAEPERARAGYGWAWRYAELGRYGGQLRKLYTLYSPGQVLLVHYPDLVAGPAAVFDRACGFLGVRKGAARDPRFELAAGAGTGAGLADEPGQSADRPPPDLRARAVELFQEDIRLLESVTHRSFGAWLTPSGGPAPVARAADI